jgi:hypothetical protein
MLGWIIVRGIIILEDDRFDSLRGIVVSVQWIFILVGWEIVSWRWLRTIVFYLRRMGIEVLNLIRYHMKLVLMC